MKVRNGKFKKWLQHVWKLQPIFGPLPWAHIEKLGVKMNSEERGLLDDKQMLFTLLTALVKKNGGEIKIHEDEMDSVTTRDMMMMYYDRNSKEIILSMKLLNPLSEEQDTIH